MSQNIIEKFLTCCSACCNTTNRYGTGTGQAILRDGTGSPVLKFLRDGTGTGFSLTGTGREREWKCKILRDRDGNGIRHSGSGRERDSKVSPVQGPNRKHTLVIVTDKQGKTGAPCHTNICIMPWSCSYRPGQSKYHHKRMIKMQFPGQPG
jgi:hypothetical protein